MHEALTSYGLFLAETVTLVGAIVIGIGLVITLVGRQTRAGRHRPTIELKSLNRRYDDLVRAMRDQMLSGPEAKAARKADRRREKSELKDQRRRARHPLPTTGTETAPGTEITTGTEAATAPGRAGDTGTGTGRPRVFVLDFHGDLRATQVTALREEVTAVLMTATERDEVVLRLENPGGTVHDQGLAASQLQRLKDGGLQLTVAVDKVAASGGYMMACVAHTILAAPFAVVGSIGVIDQLPNFHRLLDRAGVDFEMFKGGESKRTVTMFGRTTDEDRVRRHEQVQEVHELFKQFVHAQRPGLDITEVATGQYWYGTRALELGLVDRLITSDDYLLAARDRADLFQVRHQPGRSLRRRLASGISTLLPPSPLP